MSESTGDNADAPFFPPPDTEAVKAAETVVPVVSAESTVEGRHRSRGKLVGGIVGVVALLGAGAFAAVKIGANDDDGGAASPTEVGTQLIAALDNEDLLGVIDLLLPGERDTFRQPFIDLIGNLKRIEVLDASASTDQIGGVDIQFTDVSVRDEPTNVADISNIFLSGSASVAVDGTSVPLGSLLIDEAFGGDRPKMDEPAKANEFTNTRLTVVEREGRWYLSLFYTAAEASRGDAAIPEVGVVAAGAATPESAVDAMLQAISDQNLTTLIASLDPTEAEALQRYAPLFLDDAQSTVGDADIIWKLTDRTYSVEGSGDRRSVGIDTFTFTGSASGDTAIGGGDSGNGDQSATITYSHGCLGGTIFGEDFPDCTLQTDAANNIIDQLGAGDPATGQQLADSVRAAFADFSPTGIAVHEVNGTWFVSPLRTAFDLVDAGLSALDHAEITAVIDAAKAFADSFSSAIDDPFSTDGSGSDGSGGDGSGGDSAMGDQTAINTCYVLTDGAAAMQCFQDGIAAGTIESWMVSAQYRFPECGVGEVYWSDIYNLSDDEFVALAERASPCFRDLVTKGTIEAWEVPSELIDPTCLEGKNRFSEFDQAYTDRFQACTDEARKVLENT